MDAIWRYFKVQLPGYLKSLPIPKTLGGFFDLGRDEWLSLLPFFLFLTILLYLIFSPVLNFISKPRQPRPRVNRKQKLAEDKVVNCFDMEDLGDKAAFCRCWKSSKFPYCDGTHNAHNKDTGDNVGPLIVQHKKDDK